LIPKWFLTPLPTPPAAQFILWLLWNVYRHNRRANLLFRDPLINCHLRIVRRIAHRIIRKRFDHRVKELTPEFVAGGNLGLVEAWKTFNPLKGMKPAFSGHNEQRW